MQKVETMTDYADAKSTNEHEGLAHVMPVPILLAVFAALIVLTFATVAATWIDLGAWNLWLAMGIATVKAGLVAAYFMHLRYDNPFYTLLFAAALTFLALFIALTLMDTLEYRSDLDFQEKVLQQQ